MINYPIIYLWQHLSLLLLNDASTSMHSHYVIEIYIALDSYFQMNFGQGFKRYRSLIINSNIPHQFKGDSGIYALILINPGHKRAYPLIHHLLKNVPFMKLNIHPFQDILTEFQNQHLIYNNAHQLIEKLLTDLNRDLPETSQEDQRIVNTISFIQRSYKETIKLSSLASYSNLSTSRLRHLFKQETGTTIRQFILNMRVTEAVKLIINGTSKTDAAHEAGFSDSDHLSRSFRRFYGLKLSNLYRYKNNRNKAIQYFPKISDD